MYATLYMFESLENVPSDMCTQRRFRSACAFAQSDQNLHLATSWIENSLYSHDIIFLFFFIGLSNRIIKNKYLVIGDWNQSNRMDAQTD